MQEQKEIQKPSNAQLNNMEQHPPFIWRSKQTSIDGYICYLVDEDGPSHGKEAAVTNYDTERLPSSLKICFKCITWKRLTYNMISIIIILMSR